LKAWPQRADLPLVLLLASVAALACFESSDGDLGFHLATGREILATGHIPSSNVLSFGEPQHAWLLHQWLPAVLFELLWRHWGIAALIGMKMLVVSATWAAVYASARLLGASLGCALSACLFAACASAFRFEIRPYIFTHLTLALSALSIAWYHARRASAAWLCAGAAFVLGSQLHAGALDSLAIMLLYAAGCGLEALRARYFGPALVAPQGLRVAALWLTVSTAALGCSAGLLALYHPWGARILAFPFTMASDAYWGAHLIEFRHAWKLPISPLLAYWAWLAVVCLALLVSGRAWHVGLSAAVLVYALTSLYYVRMVYAFAIISAPLVAATWTRWLRDRPALAPRRPLLWFGLLACLAPFYSYRDHAPGFGLSSYVWPLDQFAFMRRHALRGRSFVSDAWAGPFLGMFYPQQKAFFDTRLEAYSQDFALNVYQRIRYAEAGWDALLDRYRIDVLLLRYTTPGEAHWQAGKPNLRQRLAGDARYSLVHFDDVGELFVRRNPEHAALIAELGIAGLDPDRRRFLQRPASCADALLRAAHSGNHSSTLLGLSALALADAGDTAHAMQFTKAALEQAPADAWLLNVQARLAAQPR
jgi:hypothetical protein